MSDKPNPSDDWRVSSYTGSNGGNCVEVNGSLDAVRDSKQAAGPVLGVSVPALVAAVKAGEIGR